MCTGREQIFPSFLLLQITLYIAVRHLYRITFKRGLRFAVLASINNSRIPPKEEVVFLFKIVSKMIVSVSAWYKI
jgi:hypothetical protein